MHIPKDSQKKLDSKTHTCLFLGYDSDTKGYRLYDNISKKVIISRDVIFDESKVGFKFLESSQPEDNILYLLTPTDDNNSNSQGAKSTETLDFQEVEQHNEPSQVESLQVDESNHSGLPSSEIDSTRSPNLNQKIRQPAPADPSAGPPVRRYPTRQRVPSIKLRDFWTLLSEIDCEPIDFHMAAKHKDWRKAIQKEIDSILKMQT